MVSQVPHDITCARLPMDGRRVPAIRLGLSSIAMAVWIYVLDEREEEDARLVHGAAPAIRPQRVPATRTLVRHETVPNGVICALLG